MIMVEWGVSALFSQTVNEQVASNNSSFDQQLGRILAQSLDDSSNPQKTLNNFSQDNIQLALITPEQLSLPDPLHQQLLDQKQLLLQSSDSIGYYYPIKDNSMILSIQRPVETAPNNFPLQLLFNVLFYSCIAAALLIWARPLIKRLINLRTTTRAFGEGDLQQRIDEGSSLYISDIEKEFNRMADRIETLIADNKLLSNAVSHDLKTPLARLRFGIDVLEEAESPEQRKKYLAKISRDLQEMEGLVETLLCYARLDQAKVVMNTDKVDLVSFINELIASMQFGDIQVNWSPPTSDHFVVGDKRYLSLLINNLVLNATQHAKHSIAIKLVASSHASKLIVEDDGPGIPANQRQAVLKPFVRGQEDRSALGHGMGLAIVNRIIHWHRWGLNIGQSPSLGGAQVEVTIN